MFKCHWQDQISHNECSNFRSWDFWANFYFILISISNNIICPSRKVPIISPFPFRYVLHCYRTLPNHACMAPRFSAPSPHWWLSVSWPDAPQMHRLDSAKNNRLLCQQTEQWLSTILSQNQTLYFWNTVIPVIKLLYKTSLYFKTIHKGHSNALMLETTWLWLFLSILSSLYVSVNDSNSSYLWFLFHSSVFFLFHSFIHSPIYLRNDIEAELAFFCLLFLNRWVVPLCNNFHSICN